MPRVSRKPIQSLKGFKDILPAQQKYWQYFLAKALPLLKSHGFERIDLPVLEHSTLYYKGTGKNTDIVEKELYSFEDKSGDDITLRPEFTPGVCRAYIEHGMLNKTQPVKLFALGQVFRHDRPQAGRYRQFNQLNLEAIGSASAILDAQLIVIAYRLLESLGLPIIVHINSIGDPEDRQEYVSKFKQYLTTSGRKKELCDDCKSRYSKNPLRILDCKEKRCQEIVADAPKIIDFLGEEAKKHFMQVLEYLDDLEIKYHLDVNLVRGLDYYNRTTFEIYLFEEDPQKSQGALLGGGRYDGLMEILGGRPTPAVGFAVGVERIINKIKETQIEIPEINTVDIFIAQLGDEARKECFKLHQKLLAEGLKIAEAFSKDGLKNQLEKANQLQAKVTLILGQKELLDHTIIIRDMQSGIQETVNYDKIVQLIKKRVDPEISNVKSYRLKGKAKVKTDDQPKKNLSAKELSKIKKEFHSSLDIADDGLLKEDIK